MYILEQAIEFKADHSEDGIFKGVVMIDGGEYTLLFINVVKIQMIYFENVVVVLLIGGMFEKRVESLVCYCF